jgi:hypothetical protein
MCTDEEFMFQERLTVPVARLGPASSRTIPKTMEYSERHPMAQLQRALGNRRLSELLQAKRLMPSGRILPLQPPSAGRALEEPGKIQRSPKAPPPSPAEPDAIDDMFEGLQVARGLLDLSLDVIASEPLSSEEMYELLLVRRAEPLSVPASVVNEAPQRISSTDARIAAVDQEIQKATAEIDNIGKQSKRLRGSSKDVAKLQIQKLRSQTENLKAERKQLLSDKVRIRRGEALGTIGRGAAAGTGQITYAAIQVVDAKGKRISLEFSETSSTEHAEEQIVRRLRATMKPEDLAGAKIIVVTDQKVCQARCQKALAAFAKEFGVDLVESRYFVRPRISKPGEASPRTTLVTSTKPSSADLPVTEKIEEIYRRPGSTADSVDVPPSPGAPRQTQPSSPVNTPDGAASGRTTRSSGEQDNTASLRGPKTAEVLQSLRARSAMMEAGGNLIVDLVMDLLMSKFQQWRNGENLREALKNLQPSILDAQKDALQKFMSDPWASTMTSTDGWYYNVYLRIAWTTRTIIGGGRAVVFPPYPHAHISKVEISRNNMNKTLSSDESVKVPGVGEGATGAMVNATDTQYVVYSEPL